MNRRDVLKYTSLSFGYLATAGAVSALVSGCKVEPKIDFEPKFFSLDEASTVRTIVDAIFPKTETPSASEVGVVEFTDSMLGEVAGEEEKGLFKQGLQLLNEAAQAKGGKIFNDLDAAAQVELLKEIDTNAYSEEENAQDKGLSQFWRGVKGNTYFGYFNSETIGKDVLAYAPVPGPYEGCTDISVSGGKVWSLS